MMATVLKSPARRRWWRRRRSAVAVVVLGALAASALLTVGREWIGPVSWPMAERRLVSEVTAMGGTFLRAGSPPTIVQIWGGSCYFVVLQGREVGDAGLSRFADSTGDPIVSLDIRNTGVTDAGLEHLAGKRFLDCLKIGNDEALPGAPPSASGVRRNRVGDEGMRHLGRLDRLRELDLAGTSLTDAGLARLSKLPSLVILGLGRTKVTGTGLAGLASIPRLIQLSAEDSRFDDAGLEHLAGAKVVQYLNLRHSRITGSGLGHLALLPRLEDVELDGCPIVGETLAQLAPSGSIRDLSLSGVPLVRTNLEFLRDPKAMPALKKLNLRRCGISEDDVAELRKSRPGMKILIVEPPMVLDPRGFYLPGPD